MQLILTYLLSLTVCMNVHINERVKGPQTDVQSAAPTPPRPVELLCVSEHLSTLAVGLLEL